MDPFFWILIAIAANWLLPLLMFAYPLLMMWIFKDFQFIGCHGIFPIFELAKKDVEPWHAKWWRDWAGVGLFGFMCLRREVTGDIEDFRRTVVHEGTHCEHQVILGLMFWIFYIGHSSFIWLFQSSKHAYLDNWSERLARKYAGQQVDIKPPDGGWQDRWPWW